MYSSRMRFHLICFFAVLFYNSKVCSVSQGKTTLSHDAADKKVKKESPECFSKLDTIEKTKAMDAFLRWVKKKPFRFKLSGSMRLDAFFDSRIGYDFWQGIDFNSPRPRKLDPNEEDINNKSQFTIIPWPLLQLDVLGPKVWGAKSSALIKADIVGRTFPLGDELFNSYGLPRIKHAFCQFDWESTSLRCGLYYHPLAMVELCPDTVSVNGGEMFDPFQYSFMFQVRHRFDPMEIVAAVGRIPYKERSRHSISPHFYLRMNVFVGDHLLCVGSDFRTMVPRLETDSSLATNLTAGANGYKESEVIKSFIPFIAARFKKDDFMLKLRFTYAENAAIFDQIGGYAVCQRDPATDRRMYTKLRSWNIWMDALHANSKREIGLFVAFAKNIGSRNKIQKDPSGNLMIFGWGVNADYMFRVQPRIRVFRGPITLGVELEHTRAAYGTTNDCGKVDDGCPVPHTRVIASIIYAF